MEAPRTQRPDPTTPLRGQLTLQFTLQQNDGSVLSRERKLSTTHAHTEQRAVGRRGHCARAPRYVPPTNEEEKGPRQQAPQRSFKSSATSYSRGEAKATQPVSDKPGIRTQAQAPCHGLAEAERNFQAGEPTGAEAGGLPLLGQE